MLPPFAEGCASNSASNEIEFIYPVSKSSIYVATDESHKKREIVFEIRHHNNKSTVYWHLDNKLIGITNSNHQLSYIPKMGNHTLTVVDDNGQSESVVFDIVN